MLARTTITKTIAVVIMVSLRVGHVTLAASERTCCRKSNGFVFAISHNIRAAWARLRTSSEGTVRPKLKGREAVFQASRRLFIPMWGALYLKTPALSIRWQEWRDSNPQPPVLET